MRSVTSSPDYERKKKEKVKNAPAIEEERGGGPVVHLPRLITEGERGGGMSKAKCLRHLRKGKRGKNTFSYPSSLLGEKEREGETAKSRAAADSKGGKRRKGRGGGEKKLAVIISLLAFCTFGGKRRRKEAGEKEREEGRGGILPCSVRCLSSRRRRIMDEKKGKRGNKSP